MVDRIVAIRETEKLNQEEFAKKIGVSRNFVSLVETGKRNLSDRTIADICRIFNIDETWLRTGKGEMFMPIDNDEEFDRICMEIQLSDDEFIKDIMRKYWKLDENGKAIIRQMLSGLQDKNKGD